MKRLPLFVRVLPVYAIILGLCLYPFVAANQDKRQVIQAGETAARQLAVAPAAAIAPRISGKPVRLLIPKLGIDLVVVDGHYLPTQKAWTVAYSQANYATNTAPNNNYQDGTLLYGHYFDWVLGRTRDLQTNDVAYVYTDNNHIFQYTYSGETIAQPTDVTIFEALRGQPSLSLMTCKGNWAQQRRIMKFRLVKVS